jgi:hypothetical protein
VDDGRRPRVQEEETFQDLAAPRVENATVDAAEPEKIIKFASTVHHT